VLIETYICAIADWKNVLSACKNQNLKNGYAIPEFAWRSRVSIYFIKRSYTYTDSRVEVYSQRNGGSNNSAEIENTPEDTDKSSLLNLSGVREDEGTLGRPQQAGANAENSTSSNDKPTSITVYIHSTVSDR
jgi:hypothetical protein